MTSAVDLPATPDLPSPGVDPELLDCWQVTVALALHRLGVDDVIAVLGSQWWFADTGERVELELDDPDARVLRATGCELTCRPEDGRSLADACAAALAAGAVPLLVSDAYDMPWAAYHGHKHVEHSAMVTGVDARGGLTIVDGYANKTEWGDCVPLATTVEPATVAALEALPLTKLVRVARHSDGLGVDVRSAIEANAAALVPWRPTDAYGTFAGRYCRPDVDAAEFDAFCELCWTVERRRRLNARWFRAVEAAAPGLLPPDFGARFDDQVGSAWADVNRFAYLSLRRLRTGRAPAATIEGLVAKAAAVEGALAAELVERVGAGATR